MTIKDLLKDRPLVFFDLETTGTDIKRDKILEIYAVKYNTDGSIDELHQRFNPEMKIPADSTEIHGITDEDVKDEPMFTSKSIEIHKFVDGCDLGGYNCIKFDIPFLMEEFNRTGIKFFPLNREIIDPFKIISKFESYQLGDVYKRYFDEEIDDAHNAEADIKATIRVFEEQMNRYELTEITDVTKICRSGKDGKVFVDFGGVFYQEGEDYYYGIGKNKDKLVRNHMDYLGWVVDKSDMASNTKVVGKILQDKFRAEKKQEVNK